MFKLQYQTASVRLQVVHEIMRDLKVGEYTIKLNHRLLLDAMMRVRPDHKLPCCAHLICLTAGMNVNRYYLALVKISQLFHFSR